MDDKAEGLYEVGEDAFVTWSEWILMHELAPPKLTNELRGVLRRYAEAVAAKNDENASIEMAGKASQLAFASDTELVIFESSDMFAE